MVFGFVVVLLPGNGLVVFGFGRPVFPGLPGFVGIGVGLGGRVPCAQREKEKAMTAPKA
jgi:hypothetical protein